MTALTDIPYIFCECKVAIKCGQPPRTQSPMGASCLGWEPALSTAEQRGSLTTRSRRERPALRFQARGGPGGALSTNSGSVGARGACPVRSRRVGILSITQNSLRGIRNCFLFKILPASHCSPRIKTTFPSNGMIPVDRGGGGSHQQCDFLPRFSTSSESTLDAPLLFAQGRGADEASAPTRSLEPQG